MPALFTQLGALTAPSGERPSARLVCFPHSGGSCFAFQGLAELLPDVEVLGVTLAGRGHRICEPADVVWERVAVTVTEALADLPPAPYGLLGHSLGGLLAFAVAQRAAAAGLATPRFVGVSACPPPHRHDVARSATIAALDDRALLELMVTWGGLTPQDIERPAMRRLVSGIRADFALGTDVPIAPPAPIAAPLLTWGSPDDDVVDHADLAEWEGCCELPVRHHAVRGGHFYLTAELPGIAEVLTQELRPAAGVPC